MRTNLASHHRVRTAAAAALALIAAAAAPLPAGGQVMMKSHPQGAAADFAKFLPPVAPVPWLEAKWRAPDKNPDVSRDSTRWAALLLTLRPVSTWPSTAARAASASQDYAGM
jgi:hypothetical protein